MRARCPICNKFCSTKVGDLTANLDVEASEAADIGSWKRDADIILAALHTTGGDLAYPAYAALRRLLVAQGARRASGGPSFLTVRGEVKVERTSECCGDEVASATVEIESDVADEDAIAKVRDHLLSGDSDEHCLEIDEGETSYAEDGDGKRDSPYVESVRVTWCISCCGERLVEGEVSGTIDEWEEQ